MSVREVPVKKYVVRLSAEEREQLNTMIRKGKSSAQRLMKARILLKADVCEGGEGWSDSEIVKALETSLTTVYRTRQQLVEEGLEAVLSRKKPSRPSVLPIFDGEKATGALGIANRVARTFSSAETALLIEVGRALALSLARS